MVELFIERRPSKVVPSDNTAVGAAFPADRSARSTPPTLFRDIRVGPRAHRDRDPRLAATPPRDNVESW